MNRSPFDYLKSINMTKEDIMDDDIAEKDYVPFVVNRSLSNFNDTVLMANEMNLHPDLDKRLQYDFLRHIVRKRKRFSKWAKPEELSNIELIKRAYGYSDPKARMVLDLITPEQIEVLRKKYRTGGKTP